MVLAGFGRAVRICKGSKNFAVSQWQYKKHVSIEIALN
jgi:hypothetical protein